MNFGVYNDLTPLLEARYTFDQPWRKDSSISKSMSSSPSTSPAPPNRNPSEPSNAPIASPSKDPTTSRKRQSPERRGRKGKNNFDVVKNTEEDKTRRVASETKTSTKTAEEGYTSSPLVSPAP